MRNRWIKRTHAPSTIARLSDEYLIEARKLYRKRDRSGNLRSTREADQQKLAIKDLYRVRARPDLTHSPTLAELHPSEICAELLYLVRDQLEREDRARTDINKRIHRLRRVFKWAAQPPRRWIAPEVIADLKLVESLKRGRTTARESEPVTSAAALEAIGSMPPPPSQTARPHRPRRFPLSSRRGADEFSRFPTNLRSRRRT